MWVGNAGFREEGKILFDNMICSGSYAVAAFLRAALRKQGGVSPRGNSSLLLTVLFLLSVAHSQHRRAVSLVLFPITTFASNIQSEELTLIIENSCLACIC